MRNPNLRKAEVPFHFGQRFTGQSKASTKEAFKYFNLLWTLRFGEGSLRFIGFALIGVTGILVNSLFLFLATDKLRIYYLVSAGIATVASTLWNFSLTEAIVYRAQSQAQGRVEKAGMVLCGECDCPGLADPDNLFDDQHNGNLLRDFQPRIAGSLDHPAIPGGG